MYTHGWRPFRNYIHLSKILEDEGFLARVATNKLGIESVKAGFPVPVEEGSRRLRMERRCLSKFERRNPLKPKSPNSCSSRNI